MANNNDLFQELFGELIAKIEVGVFRLTMRNAIDGKDYFIGLDDDGAIVLANQEDAFIFRSTKEMADFISKSKIEPSAVVEGMLTLKNAEEANNYFNRHIIDGNLVKM